MKFLFTVCLLVFCLYSTAAEFYGRVVHVADGDTFTILVDGDRFRVRMQHIDAPESTQEWGPQSRILLQSLIDTKDVYVEFHSIDTFGRLVGVVYLNKSFGKYKDCVNQEMVRRGMAFWFQTYSRDFDYYVLQEEAKKAKRGVWSSREIEYPWNYRKEKRNAKEK